jgi:hypothetical protein
MAPEEYEALRKFLDAVRPPLYLIPSNYDRRELFLEAFADHVCTLTGTAGFDFGYTTEPRALQVPGSS